MYKKQLFHFRGEALVRSAACAEQLKLGSSVPRRDCPKTSEESRKGWGSDPYGCVRDLRICVDCVSCPRPDDTDSGAATQSSTADAQDVTMDGVGEGGQSSVCHLGQ
ncbi:hypothetical protein PWT90_03424 [Aphanocladium album]|nr:hypothetical protein PWT90_03424 [Aphanocladium album]